MEVLGNFAFTPAFSLPIRLFLEAKFIGQKTRITAVRNEHGVIYDINENFVRGPDQRLRKRFRYVYALFSAKGFTKEAQEYARTADLTCGPLRLVIRLPPRNRSGSGVRPARALGTVSSEPISGRVDARGTPRDARHHA